MNFEISPISMSVKIYVAPLVTFDCNYILHINYITQYAYGKPFLGPNPKGWGPIGLGCPSVRPSVRLSVRQTFLYGLELLNGRS